MPFEWVECDPVEPTLGPPKPWQCAAGFKSHTMTMEIENGDIRIWLDRGVCTLCCDGLENIEREDFQAYEIPVRLTFRKETVGYESPEIAVWWDIEVVR